MNQNNFAQKLTRWLVLFTLLSLIFLAVAPSAKAFDGRGDERVVIRADEVVEDDLYVGANDFILDGTVKGDVVVGARTITINGVIEGDLIAFGQVIVINGIVQDDVRGAGASLQIGPDAELGDDIVFAGYSLETRAGSSVDGDIVFGGYQALLSGEVKEDVLVGASALAIEGSIGGNVNAAVDSAENRRGYLPAYNRGMPAVPSIPGGLTLGEDAKIGGNLEYSSPVRVEIAPETIGGRVVYTPSVDKAVPPSTEVNVPPPSPVLTWTLNSLRYLVALIVVGLLFAWLAPAWVITSANKIQAKPLPSLGWGALVLIVFPVALLLVIGIVILIAILLGALTLGNLVASLGWFSFASLVSILVLLWLVVTYFTRLVVGYIIGRFILSQINAEWTVQPVWSLLVGVVILAILIAIPYLGTLVSLGVTLVGLGALLLLWIDRPRPPAEQMIITPSSTTV